MKYIFSGANLKDLRHKNRISQLDLARMLSVSNSAVSSWEKEDTKPNTGRIEELTEKLKCSPNALFIKLSQAA